MVKTMDRNIFVIALALVVLASISFAGISINGYTVSETTYKPGQPGVATVTVTNPLGADRVTSLTLTIDTPFEISLSAAPQLADISAGGSAVVSIPFKVKPDAKPGIYLINAIFKGYSADTSGGSSLVTNTVSIPITIVQTPIFNFNTDNNLLTGIDDVTLTITNNGGAASNVRLGISGNISLYGKNEIYLGDLSNTVTTHLELDSRSASDGPTDMLIVMNYDDELGNPHTVSYPVRMTVKKQKLDVTFIQNSDVITRQETPVTLGIKNNGNTTLMDVRMIFTGNNTIRLKDSNELNFGNIIPGEIATTTVSMFVDLSPGLNRVPTTLTWSEKDVAKTQDIEVPLTISSDADVGVYLEAKPSPLTVGQEHTISVLVSNLGSYPIENVAVSFSSDSLSSLDISKDQYIGSLNNDDFSTVQFKEKVKDVADGQYPVDVKVTYRDQSGEWKTKDIQRTVSIYRPPAGGFDPIILVPIVLILGVLVWYFKFRKGKQPSSS